MSAESRINARMIEFMPISDLVAYPDHARSHSASHIAKLAKSVAEFGVVQPVVIDERSIVIGGHALIEAAKKLGYSEIPALRLTGLSEGQKRVLRLALNRLPEDGRWDRARLAKELSSLISLDIDVTLGGFEVTEVDLLIRDLDIQAGDEHGSDDDIPGPVPNQPVVNREGDLWQMGKHLLIHGDARHEDVYSKLLGSSFVRMAFTDPPYNVRISDIGNRGRSQHAEFAMASGEMTAAQYTRFLTGVFHRMAAVSSSGAVHFICTDAKHLTEMTAATNDAYDEHLTVAVWNKDAGGMGGLYRNQHELVFVEKVGTAPILNNVALGRNGRNRTNVWTYRGLASFGRERLETLATHPTVKPVALVADAILDVSKRGDLVLDPFAGSGTTVVAAEKTGRVARAIEIDPRYCDTIIRRWELYTGRRAFHVQSGLAFESISQQRIEAGA
jgi:hypothetical protein